jgi:hypothetical protein
MMRRWAGWAMLAAISLLARAAVPTAETPVPTPESVLGAAPCADYTLATSEQISRYFRALDTASDRLRLFDIGPTTEGRRQLLAVISSADNLRDLPRYQRISRALALNRDASGAPLSDAVARQLAIDGRAMVWLDFGLHSNEPAPAQAAPWLAWSLVTSETMEAQEIRDNSIVILVPDMNPDGTTLMADWYTTHQGTPWEMTLPTVFHRYAGHDNNRDWFMFTQRESRNVARQLYEEYLPQIVFDHHQTAPFPARIFVPPFAEPANVHIPPPVLRGIERLGSAIQHRLGAEGKTGAISRIGFDMWWNGGMRTAPYFHNMVGLLTETAHTSPTPMWYDSATFPARFANGQPTLQPGPDYPRPYLGGRWTLRQSCEYVLSASMAVLVAGARERHTWQYDIYQMARDSMRAGAGEAYVISAVQWDRGAALHLVNALRMGGVRVERATAAFHAGDHDYQAGSYVIPGAQPFLPYVRDLLTPQRYPGPRSPVAGSREAPYDITGWTLSLQMGVKVDKVPTPVAGPRELVLTTERPRGTLASTERIAAFAIDPRANASFIVVNRLLGAGTAVSRSVAPIDDGDRHLPAGAFLVEQRSGARGGLPDLASALGVDVVGLSALPPGPVVPVVPRRIAVYSPWGGNVDEAWTRWVLEQYEFPYGTIRDAAVREGNLHASWDVIVLPDSRYEELAAGVPAGRLPKEFTGGLGAAGIRNLRRFVTEGGILVAQNGASELPLRAFGLPIVNALAGIGRREFSVPGALLRVSIDTRHPVGWGVQNQVAGFFSDSPAFLSRRPPGAKQSPVIVASYEGGNPLLSGWAFGADHLRDTAAVVDVPLGKGRVVLLGLRAQHRGQSHATFKLLFNAIYRHNTVPR